MNKIIIIISSTIPTLMYSWSAFSQVVFDPLNFLNTTSISETSKSILEKDTETSTNTKETSTNTKNILDTNKQILETVKKTLEAVTGDRKSDAQTASKAAVGDGFSASAAPSSAETATSDALDIILDGIKTEFSGSGKSDNKDNKNPSFEAAAQTTIDMNALIKGIKKSLETRKKAYEQVSNNIGNTKDIKGSIDQNSQIQAQNGLVLNELIGVNNSILSSNQADSRRQVTDTFNSMKSMSYNDQ